ncbi:hypothetical protein EMPS_11374 [Entomortierella parvispora]|uniref:FAD-binding PCMH-type domain-containing protein n=1 Tax=Entomortierella parvispora TaxID=205924 RepID=A0A9P3M2J1_9FUNG|nr:hypothetical protein EMPS_11374 [Entomortierella parvispora]
MSAKSALLACLEPLGSKVLTMHSPEYSQERLDYNPRFDYRPLVIVMAASASDVQFSTKCATEAKVAVAPRSGGHSYEGYSIGGQNGSLVIDLGGFTAVTVSTNGLAKVGAGIRLGPLYLELYNQGGWTINAGTCPSVGVGGIALGGGFGLLSRKYGLLLDRITEMQVVNAMGELLTVSATSDPDLFFALRGAGGGSFGVVIEFTLQAIRPAPVATSFTYNWPNAMYLEVFRAFIDTQQQALRDVGVGINISPAGLMMYGLFDGVESKQSEAMKQFLEKVPSPTNRDVREGRVIDSQLRFAYLSGNPKDINALSLQGGFKAAAPRPTKGKSLVYSKPLLNSTIKLLGKWGSVSPKGSAATYIIIDIWGGAIADVPVKETAFIHRGASAGIEFVAEWIADANQSADTKDYVECFKWINDAYAEFLEDFRANYGPVRGYQNYIDKDIPDWQDAYYGEALTKLKQIKRAVDPSNTFRFPQSIPLAHP